MVFYNSPVFNFLHQKSGKKSEKIGAIYYTTMSNFAEKREFKMHKMCPVYIANIKKKLRNDDDKDDDEDDRETFVVPTWDNICDLNAETQAMKKVDCSGDPELERELVSRKFRTRFAEAQKRAEAIKYTKRNVGSMMLHLNAIYYLSANDGYVLTVTELKILRELHDTYACMAEKWLDVKPIAFKYSRTQESKRTK
jgi:hypothetical protein